MAITEYMEDYEAVKIVDGKEVDWIDPVHSVQIDDSHFIIEGGGGHKYKLPVDEYQLWLFRPMKQI